MFESLASCFAAYEPSFGWRKLCRLRGFAFRCSASLDMTDAGGIVVSQQIHLRALRWCFGKSEAERAMTVFDSSGNYFNQFRLWCQMT
jgi:hypothetical protein